MSRYRTLEDALVGEGHISRQELDRVLAQRNGVRGGLGWSLVEAGRLSEEALAHCLSRLYDLPLVDLATALIEPGVLDAFPLDRMRRDVFLPLQHNGNRLVVAVADPGNVLLRDDLIQWNGGPVDLVVTTRAALLDRLGRVDASQRILNAVTEDFKLVEADNEEGVTSLEGQTGDASPTIRLVDTMLLTALEHRASDVHIEADEKYVQVKYRIDGMLRPAMEPMDRRHQATIVSRIKIMAELDIAEHRVPQDGRFKLKVRGRSIDFRVSILPSNFGEAVVIRILDKEADHQGTGRPPPGHPGHQRIRPAPVPPAHPPAPRDDPGDGPHRVGQDHHPVRGHLGDPHGPGQDHHHRGPHRIPAPRGGADPGQREEGPDLRPRPAQHPAPRPGQDPGRGDPRLPRRPRSPSSPP